MNSSERCFSSFNNIINKLRLFEFNFLTIKHMMKLQGNQKINNFLYENKNIEILKVRINSS